MICLTGLSPPQLATHTQPPEPENSSFSEQSMGQPNLPVHEVCPPGLHCHAHSSTASSSTRVENVHFIKDSGQKLDFYEAESIMGLKIPNCSPDLVEEPKDKTDLDIDED